MDQNQYEELRAADASVYTMRAHSFLGADRTLLLGYTVDRDTWHVYLKDDQIHLLVYTYQEEVLRYEANPEWEASRLVPDKRVYPESTDAVFAWRMQQHGLEVPYTKFDPDRWERYRHMTFHGQLHD